MNGFADIVDSVRWREKQQEDTLLITATADRKGITMTRLRFERIRGNETARQLSQRTGVSATTISAIENQRMRPWSGQRKRLADAYGLPEYRLLEVVTLTPEGGAQ
jgi:hypothetical protein